MRSFCSSDGAGGGGGRAQWIADGQQANAAVRRTKLSFVAAVDRRDIDIIISSRTSLAILQGEGSTQARKKGHPCREQEQVQVQVLPHPQAADRQPC